MGKFISELQEKITALFERRSKSADIIMDDQKACEYLTSLEAEKQRELQVIESFKKLCEKYSNMDSPEDFPYTFDPRWDVLHTEINFVN